MCVCVGLLDAREPEMISFELGNMERRCQTAVFGPGQPMDQVVNLAQDLVGVNIMGI